MAVADVTILIVLLCALNWGIVYRWDKMVGSFFFFLIGIGIMATSPGTFSHSWTGFMLMFIGLFAGIKHWFLDSKQKNPII